MPHIVRPKTANCQNASILDKRFTTLPRPQTNPANTILQTMYRTIGPIQGDLPEPITTADPGATAKGATMSIVLPKEQASGLREGAVWKHLRGDPDGKVYSLSGPGPVSNYPAMEAMVARGWFEPDGDGWEITEAGEVAADSLATGEITSL
jgi:hypothetical protein